MNKFFKKIMYFAFFILITSLIISSLFPVELAEKYFYRAIWFIALLGIVGIGLAFSIFNFFKKRNFAFGITYLGILLVLIGGFVTFLFGEEGFIEMKEGRSVDSYYVEDDIVKPLGFSLFLRDFSVEFYPEKHKGMHFVKSYKSTILIKDGDALKKSVIEVNKPFSFGGYDFYQYGYDEEYPSQTVLQVVKDPGLPLVYAGYFILLLGMVFSFKKTFFKV